ncbi:MAG: hypothetical protein JRN15_10090, partial [Nitrososphaerota archaeon]|nr:hypothetical protein [Nitrososphaerota archaeon]
IHFQIYENGLDVARDLSLSRLDLGIAPILAGFMFCSLGAPFKIIAPAGSGGSSVVSATRELHSSPRVATTKLSTMELLMKTSIHEHFLAERSAVIYASNPREITKGMVSKQFDAACIWEPYATILTKKHCLTKIVTYNDLEDHICCTLSASNTLSDRIMSKIAKRFKASILEFSRAPDSFLDQYSKITGFDQKIINAVSQEYSYSTELESNSITRQFEHAGITTPDPSTIKDMIRSAE